MLRPIITPSSANAQVSRSNNSMDSKGPVCQRSIRSSCDRCRLHKIKCTITYRKTYAESTPCDRCGRAKTACVFSRRAIPRRRDRTKMSTTKKDNRSELTTVPRELKMRPYFGATVDQQLLLDMHSNPAHDWNNNDVEPGDPHMAVSQIGFVDPISSFWSEGGPMRAAGAVMAWPDTEPTIFNPHDIQAGDISPYTGACGAESTPISRSSAQHNVSETSFSYGASDDKNRNGVSQLTDLITEIADTRIILENSVCSGGSDPNGLSEYPIGRVLHLSQYFINILPTEAPQVQNIKPSSIFRPISSSTCLGPQDPSACQALQTSHIGRGPSSEETDPSKQHLTTQSIDWSHSPQPSTIHRPIDTSTMLIILSCYISLVKLYGIVFTHFETYLSRPSSVETAQGQAESDLMYSRQLQLGDLLPGDEACRKIISAMQMLLSMLASVEDQMGIPGELRALQEPTDRAQGDVSGRMRLRGSKGGPPWTTSQRELMLVVLRQDSELCQRKTEGRLIDVFAKVQSLKKVLRERMDL
ncbi:hypothetical protein GGR51DRAFT_500253 [Nemania sp. FL0031]|nr:hypothetical protein GGR51DRAFT_500253 [Nemania sp. FL0031]